MMQLKHGFEVYSVAEAVAKADIVHDLIPDERQAKVYKEEIEPNLKSQTLMFAHGFNVHFGQIVPPAECDVFIGCTKRTRTLSKKNIHRRRWRSSYFRYLPRRFR